MKFSTYTKLATDNLIKPIRSEKEQKEKKIYASLLLAEELGETASEIRKPMYKGNYHEREFSKKRDNK